MPTESCKQRATVPRNCLPHTVTGQRGFFKFSVPTRDTAANPVLLASHPGESTPATWSEYSPYSHIVGDPLTANTTAPATKPEVRRNTGRFRESRRVKVFRMGMDVLQYMSPMLASHLGYRLLATPPRAAERPWQKQLRLQSEHHRVPGASGEIAVYAWGKPGNPTILMVHGWGARATHMGRMVKPLIESGFRVVSFDAPAHGRSSGKRTDIVAFASAVRSAAEDAGPLHTIVAHSFGAAMALWAMRTGGIDTNRLVLIGAIEHCSWICDAFGHYAGMSPAVVERMRQILVKRHPGRIDWAELSVVEMLRAVARPTLLIHDREDPEIPFAHSTALLRGSPHARLHATRGLGHHRLLGNTGVVDQVVNFVTDTDRSQYQSEAVDSRAATPEPEVSQPCIPLFA